MSQFEAKEIGSRIAQARNEAGLTQEQLAELAPFSHRSLQDYERGVTIPYRQMRDISKLLGRPVEWFLRGDQADGLNPEAVMTKLDELALQLDALDRKVDALPTAAEVADLRRLLESTEIRS